MDHSRTGFRWLAVLAAALMFAFAFAACGSDDKGDAAGEPAGGSENSAAAPSPATEAGGEVTVYATEYAFDLPETLPAGETTFTLVNKGEEQHMLILAELKPGAPSMEELLKMDEKEADKFFVEQQVIPPVKPGETGEKTITFDLESGVTYGYVCFVNSPKHSEGHGQPHAFLGMNGEFTVE